MKLAIVTGASSGIGEATASTFLENGFTVINISRREAKDSRIINLCCNLAWESDLADQLDTLHEHIEKADEVCLVHNAARMSSDTAHDFDPDDLKLGLAVNVLAPSMINRSVIPDLPKGSSIIYIGSTLSEKAVPGTYSYVTCKHANVGMMKATCQDTFGMGIHTVCVCPGFTDTEMLRNHIPEDAIRNEVGSNNAFGRLAEPAEIANIVLASHLNPALNGTVIHANLGQAEI